MRRAAAVLLGLLGAAVILVAVFAYFFATFCWEYCEPEDAPTVWDGIQFSLPFALVAVGLMTAAVKVWAPARSWMRALGVALAISAAVALVAIAIGLL